MADQAKQSPLCKEVLPPQKPNSGFGVLMVASLAMFFAIASSALMLRARMLRPCPRANQAPIVIPEQVVIEWHKPVRECGTPEYRSNADGSTTVFFELCPHDQNYGTLFTTDTQPASVEVREIR